MAVTDDGLPVATALLARRALEYTSMFDMPMIEHCEDQTLKGDGVAHEGPVAASLGLRGIPGAAESITAVRDILLAEMTGGHVHIAHMSAWTTIEAVRQGKSRGVKVTCEVCAASLHAHRRPAGRAGRLRHQHQDEPAAARSARPRRDDRRHRRRHGRRDLDRSRAASLRRKDTSSSIARRSGSSDSKLPIPITLDRLVHTGLITLSRMVELLSVNPARILHVEGGSLAAGAAADITILAPDLQVTVDETKFRSKSKNTPFHGWSFQGGVAATIVGGRTVYANPAAQLT